MNFNLEEQYQLYLTRVSLKENEMSPIQKKQLRQTFMGACGQMLILLRDDVSDLNEEMAVEVLEDMVNQVNNYFLNLKVNKN